MLVCEAPDFVYASLSTILRVWLHCGTGYAQPIDYCVVMLLAFSRNSLTVLQLSSLNNTAADHAYMTQHAASDTSVEFCCHGS